MLIGMLFLIGKAFEFIAIIYNWLKKYTVNSKKLYPAIFTSGTFIYLL